MPSIESYARHRATVNQYTKERDFFGRDVARFKPTGADLASKEACARDFRRFCEVYFPVAFHLAWSADHLRAIAKIEQVVLEGGLFALAMPRGSGKTALSVRAAIWALLYGHRRFVCLIGSTERLAEKMMEAVKV